MTFPHAGCCKNLTMTVFGQKTSELFVNNRSQSSAGPLFNRCKLHKELSLQEINIVAFTLLTYS